MRNLLLKSAVLLLSAGLSAASQAGSIGYTSSFTLNNPGNGATSTGGTFSFMDSSLLNVLLPQFDGSLGLLTGVELVLTSTYTHFSLGLAKDTAGIGTRDATIVGTAGTQFLVSHAGIGALATTTDLNSLSCSQTKVNLDASCTLMQTDSNVAFNQSITFLPGNFSHFSGAGSVTLNLENKVQFSASCDNDSGDFCQVSDTSNWSGTLGVNYLYSEPVGAPEPMSLLMFASGLFGIAAVRRQRV